MNYEGKLIWITGASRGIGRALAVAFAREGARLVLSARSEESLLQVQAECLRHTRVCTLQALDLGVSDTIREAARQVIDRHGTVDVLVHNAGISQRSTAEKTDLEVDRRIMEVNYFGPILLTKLVLPHMRREAGCGIVAVSSMVGLFGFPLRSAYAASKHAMHGFFETLSIELSSTGIAVTIVSPGRVRTDISRYALTGSGAEHGVMDPGQQSGISADRCAGQILRGLKRGKREIYAGGSERIMIYIKRFTPRLFYRIAQRIPSS
ncbi:MAG: SDR family oxidoreductase [Spirochaetaceae bacterium]